MANEYMKKNVHILSPQGHANQNCTDFFSPQSEWLSWDNKVGGGEEPYVQMVGKQNS